MPRPMLAIGVVAVIATACANNDAETAPAEGPPEPARASVAHDAAPPAPSADPGSTPSGLTALTQQVIDDARSSDRAPLRLLPDEAELVLHLRPPAWLAYAPAAELWSRAEVGNDDIHAALDAVRSCLGGLEVVDEIAIGLDTSDHIALAAHGKGLATAETWACFRREVTEQGHGWSPTITGAARGEGPQLVSADGDVGYFADDDTLVMLSKDWDVSIGMLLEGKGTPAVEGRLAPIVRRIAPDSPLWLAGSVQGIATASLDDTPLAGMRDVSLALRLEGDDVALSAAVDAGEEADAIRMRDGVQQTFDQFKGVLAMTGVPATVVPKIRFEREGDLVRLAFAMTRGELEELRAGIDRAR